MFDSLVGQDIRCAELCRILQIKPAIGEREMISWVQFDDQRGAGINAMLATYTPDDGEPFDASLAVYESFRNGSGKGVDSQCVATFEFMRVEDDPEIWIVQNADAPASWHEESIQEALAQIQFILQDWPMQREVR